MKVSPFSVNCDNLGSVSKLRTCERNDVSRRLVAVSHVSSHLVLEVPKCVAWCIWRILNDTCEINGGALENQSGLISGSRSHSKLIKIITLLMKYSGPPKMNAVGTAQPSVRVARAPNNNK